ncbi:MAG: metallophosphoesterase [Candidatus Thorarchaeota archaeon]
MENIENSDKSIIVKPNLGHPILLKIDPKLKEKHFQTDILIISNIRDLEDFKKIYKDKLTLVPILDYNWKLKHQFKKKLLEPFDDFKKKGFWARRKEKKLRKKKLKIIEKETAEDKTFFGFKISDVDYQLKKLRTHPYRGKSITISFSNIEEVPIIPISDISYLDRSSPQEHLLKYKIFGDLEHFYRILIKFTISKEVKEFLEERNFVMFDLVSSQGRINYHSIVITKQEWKNFQFVHATDLHLAERNDRIYKVVKKWAESSLKRSVDEFFSTVAKKLKIKKRKNEQNGAFSDITIPLRKRLINPNNQFRKFIKLMNKKVFQNELDFIVLTGDLVDYTVLSRFAKKARRLNQFEYEESNWKVFKDIIINPKVKKSTKGIKRGKELLCPIFTTVGNHDFRPYHYDLTWAEMYKKIGLNAAEAIALNELFSASPITAIMKSTSALKGYLSEINPSLDFSLTLGNNNFIFLNSGSDSFKNLRDLIRGHPSVTGLVSKQIKYLENLINYKIRQNSNTFLFLHGPPINTGEEKLSINIFEKKGRRFIKEKIEEFKESLFQKLGQSVSNARLDKYFNVKYGTVSSNWEKIVKFCKDYSTLVLAGHTHIQREFRLEDPETKTRVYDSPPFSLKKIENPAAVFYDNYSEIYTDAESIEKHSPFVVQTPALGLGGYKNPKTAGAYRELVIKEGRLHSFKVKFISR